MIEFSDTGPDTSVHAAEYQRLLGYPRERDLEERALELSNGARVWYARHGRPWVYARETQSLEVTDESIIIDGVTFHSKRLSTALRKAGAHSAVLVAVSAGAELEREAQRLWHEEKPDEYYFLEVYGSAVVEHLVMMTGARLCASADGDAMAVLPHYSPGYPEWNIADQAPLLELIRRRRDGVVAGEVDVLESGMLRPKKSLLAVFGLTRHTDRVGRLTDLVPCENCTLAACQYRRAAYLRPRRRSEVEAMRPAGETPTTRPAIEPLDLDARYSVNAKALRRWAGERLSLRHNDDGTIDAQFRYEGTTCSNMGRAFEFDYAVKLGPRDVGYRVLDLECAPAPNDAGHTFMCLYRSAAPQLMASIAEEKPLLGRTLNDVLSWRRAPTGPTCYCEGESREQKWGIVLETIHYALAQQEKLLHEMPTLAQRKAR